MTYAIKMMKKTVDPIRLCFVDTGSSLGTGINEKMSIFFSIRIGKGDWSSWMNDSFIKALVEDLLYDY